MGDKADQLKGKVKEAAGILTGHKDLEAEGKADRRAGEAKKKLGDVKDKVEELIEKAGDRIEGGDRQSQGRAGSKVDDRVTVVMSTNFTRSDVRPIDRSFTVRPRHSEGRFPCTSDSARLSPYSSSS
jgi:uncharacterized protein YjbJ (UPF0337 family)